MKKHLLQIFMICAAMCVSVRVTASASTGNSGICGENLTWTLNDSGVLTISGTGAMDNWVIKDVDDDYRIFSPAPWYSNLSGNIETIVIEDGVTTIGDYAFYWCQHMTSVAIPDTVTTIGDSAFYVCNSLTNVDIPDSVTTIGDCAFQMCDSLTSVTIGNSVTTIGDSAFSSCDSLTSVDIPDNITTIGESAFHLCRSLTSVTIGSSVTTIGDGAFLPCYRLIGIDVKDDNPVYSSEHGILFDKNQSNLIVYPSAKASTTYTIPDSVTTISNSAFYQCKLKSVVIPDSVTTIGDGAFRSCHKLTNIDVRHGNPAYSSENGVLFDKNQSKLIVYPIAKPDTTYTIPDSVTTIGDGAFGWCRNLTSVTIGNSVTTIGDSAFYVCDSLTSVAIPDGVTTIGDSAFSSCDSLTSVAIGNSVTAIGYRAFFSCSSLTSVAIPDSVITIGDSAFSSCDSLTSVDIPDNVTTIGSLAFNMCENLTDIYFGGSAAQWNEICGEYGMGLNYDVTTIHYGVTDVGVGVLLTNETGKTVDANGETTEKIGDDEYRKENAFVENAEFTAKVDVADADAVTDSELVTASIFWIFYDTDGCMVYLQQSEINLSDPLNIVFWENIRIPAGAKTMKILILSDNLVPLRASRMIANSE